MVIFSKKFNNKNEWQKQKYYFFRVAEWKDTLTGNIEDNLKNFSK